MDVNIKTFIKIDSFTKAFAYLTGIGSIGLIGYGALGESYVAGFGLVTLITSLLMILSASLASDVGT